jgi:hypothetical protein
MHAVALGDRRKRFAGSATLDRFGALVSHNAAKPLAIGGWLASINSPSGASFRLFRAMFMENQR